MKVLLGFLTVLFFLTACSSERKPEDLEIFFKANEPIIKDLVAEKNLRLKFDYIENEKRVYPYYKLATQLDTIINKQIDSLNSPTKTISEKYKSYSKLLDSIGELFKDKNQFYSYQLNKFDINGVKKYSDNIIQIILRNSLLYNEYICYKNIEKSSSGGTRCGFYMYEITTKSTIEKNTAEITFSSETLQKFQEKVVWIDNITLNNKKETIKHKYKEKFDFVPIPIQFPQFLLKDVGFLKGLEIVQCLAVPIPIHF